MANLPDRWKYNPLEADSDGWVPHRESSSTNKPAKKTCVLCMYAPVVFYIMMTTSGYISENIASKTWYVVQVLLGVYLYLGNIKKSS